MNYSNLVLKPGKITVSGLTAPIELHQLGSGDGLVVEGNISFLGVGQRFRGDFSNSTLSSRGMFQTSTVNSNTSLSVIPSGTAKNASFSAFNSSDPDNASAIHLRASSTESQILSSISGSGKYLPLCFYTNSIKHMLIDLNGNATHYGDTNGLVTSQGNNGYGAFYAKASGTNSSYIFFGNSTTPETGRIESKSDGSLAFFNGSTSNYLASFSSDGRLNIGSIGTADVHIKKTKTGAVNFSIENASANTGDLSALKVTAGPNSAAITVDAGGNRVTRSASGNVTGVFEDIPTGASMVWRHNGVEKFSHGPNGELGIAGNFGTAGQVLTSGGSGASPSWASAGGMNSSALVGLSGTSTLITGIPAGVKMIVISLKDVYSMDGVRIGSGSIASSGYVSRSVTLGANGSTALEASSTSTIFFLTPITTAIGSNEAMQIFLTLIDPAANTWDMTCTHGYKDGSGNYYIAQAHGYVSLAGAIDRVQIMGSNLGGSANISYM